ncbi:nucleotidyltransferase domain-containing protein [Polyangium fumosum]|uniref:Nucleotidyltransferase domain-containing protein n=1 Tax=Polyangium fumosum TaxID=889272 RepID=A0A4U1JIA3_9BACT|nr:nucleotidyltransferase domain-containing protein [Polyangium fumosum]TKD12353.1 nucleotidyltransferase domain-containing protein [Polyangium fumosum]
MTLPAEKQALLDTITTRLSAVPGVVAVVLGGSYARGMARPDSDLDVAMYYAEDSPFRIEDIRRVAAEISIAGPPDVTDFYGWGPWVNGGAWIRTTAGKVDFIYRNLDQVRRTLDEAARGVTHHHFDQQPAFGFYSVTYLAETRVCLPLHDPAGHIASLKRQVEVYPPLLKEKLVLSNLWLAEFSLVHAAAYAERGDVYAVSGALTRTGAFLTQVLFALNETYFMTDKTAMAEIAAGFHAHAPLVPPGYVQQLSRILARLGETPADLSASTRAVSELWASVVELAKEAGFGYRPAFTLV